MKIFVVSYRNSTSNHNISFSFFFFIPLYLIEILHQTTTTFFTIPFDPRCILSKFYIKPQPAALSPLLLYVVSYRNSTSNHNGGSRYSDWLEVVSYRNSTSNHNISILRGVSITLYLIEILHQTTTPASALMLLCRCILSKFYIKPQRYRVFRQYDCVVSYRNSTSNHNALHPII